MSYQAVVARLGALRPHPNADKIQLATVHGFQVVVGLDVSEGDIGVFFPTDGQLSHEFVWQASLYRRDALEKLGLPIRDGQEFGFFEANRRVRAQPFRGQKSEGLWLPAATFNFFGGLGGLTEGQTFDTLSGIQICQKYYSPATLRAMKQRRGSSHRGETKGFPKHDVTRQFRFVNRSIPEGAITYITEKLHGTSGRYGHVLDDVELPFWKRLVNRLYPVFAAKEYRYLNGSKNVILEKTAGAGWYGTNDFRYSAVSGISLHKGEVIYYELVGYVDEHRPIMAPQPIKKQMEDLRSSYGPVMEYNYGFAKGETGLFVYRIIRTNEDGVVTELTWPQVLARCAELGLKTVPALTEAILYDTREGGTEDLVKALTEGPSTLTQHHIREGVVLRVETQDGITFIKNKSWNFNVLEGIVKLDDSYVDIEEAS